MVSATVCAPEALQRPSIGQSATHPDALLECIRDANTRAGRIIETDV